MSAGYILYSLDSDKFRQMVEWPSKGQLTALAELLADGLEENDGEFDDGDPILDWPSEIPGLVKIAAKRLALPDWYGDLSKAGKVLWEGVIFNACTNCDAIEVGFRADSDGIYGDVIELAWKHLGVVPNTISGVALSAFGVRPYRFHPHGKPGQSRAEFDGAEGEKRARLEALGKSLGGLLEDAKQGKKTPEQLLNELEGQAGVSKEHKAMIKKVMNDDDSDDDEADADDWSPMHSMHTPDEVRKILTELQSASPAMKAAKKGDVREQYESELMPAITSIANEGRMLFVQVDS